MRHQSLHFDFSIIANDESMQTIKDKRKYKLQQLFKMLSLSLDTCLESFSPLAWALSMMVTWKSAQILTNSVLVQVTYWLLVYALLHHSMMLPSKQRSWNSTHIKLFKRSQSAIKCRCILWKELFIMGLFWWSYTNLFPGSGFFETQCRSERQCISTWRSPCSYQQTQEWSHRW